MQPRRGHAANMGGVEKLSDGGCGSETPKSPAGSSRHSIEPRSFMCTLLMYGRSHATCIATLVPQAVSVWPHSQGWAAGHGSRVSCAQQQGALLPFASGFF
jgi:hypothetical protein